MIDRSWIGRSLPTARLKVEAGRLAFFAKATGQAPGDRTVAPPTFLFSAYTDNDGFFTLVDQMGVERHRLLHGEQSFEYLAPVQAGDDIRVEGRVTGIEVKKGGALELVSLAYEAFNQNDVPVARLGTVLAIRW